MLPVTHSLKALISYSFTFSVNENYHYASETCENIAWQQRVTHIQYASQVRTAVVLLIPIE